jgi:hypothetical protein
MRYQAVITPTEHDKAEWSRLAQQAYTRNANAIGHRYSVASACCGVGQEMPLAKFDSLQRDYRAWLVFGWDEAFAD